MPVIRALLALLVCASLGLGAELRTLAGKTITGQVVSISDQAVELTTPAGPVRTPLNQVLELILQPVKPLPVDSKRIDIELTDGTLLHAKPDGLAIKGTEVEVTLLSGQSVHLALKNIAYYLRDGQDPVLKTKLRDLLKKKRKNDQVLKLSVSEKTKKADLNPLDGTFGDADAKGETIKFRLTGAEEVNLVLAKIQGMIFYRPDPNPVTTLCQVYDTGGNILVANKVTGDDKGYKIAVVCGIQVDLDKQVLGRIDYNINKVRFLSDMEPVKVVERSGSGLVARHRKDTNLDGGVIRVGGKVYSKGLSLHSYTELEYNLNGKYKEFTAVLGVDDQVGGDSKALVTVECDDAKVFSQEITRKDTKNLILKVKDVTTLRIIVSSKNILDLHDHVTFANAKVSQ